jgi:chemotaxis protein CheC
MLLTERQRDALAELINIAFARTGAALSELTGNRVLLAPPEVAVHEAREVGPVVATFIPGEAAWVRQVFSGPIAGDALLLLSYQSALELVNLLGNGKAGVTRLDESAREALTEVGNILLNACLGMFGNVLRVRVSFSVPHIHVQTLNDLAQWFEHETGQARYALVVYTAFRLKDVEVKGYLVLVLSIESLERLVAEIDAWMTGPRGPE